MKLVFLSGGRRAAALRYLLERGEKVVAVITPIPSAKNDRFREVAETAREFGVPVHEVRRETVTATLKSLQFDMLISCGFTYILDAAALATAKLSLNVHPTLLPAYRGARSGPYILLNGEKKSGVTVHELTAAMDDGDILAQEDFVVTAFDTPKSLYRKTQAIEPALLFGVVQQAKEGALKRRRQDPALASTYTEMRKPEDSEIDPKKPLAELYDAIRAADPDDYPAFFWVEGQKVCIKFWRPERPANEPDTI